MEKSDLLSQIEIKRAELIDIVAQYGLSSQATIQYSQELDKLLNQYKPTGIKRNGKLLSY